MRIGGWCLAAFLLAGCGDEGSNCPAVDGHCITAFFSFSDGNSFYFGGEATQSTMANMRSITANDAVEPYTVSIHWDHGKVTGPGQHVPNTVGGALQFYITRPHPTDPNKFRTSNTRYGTLAFRAVGYAKGDVIAGTFDGIRLIRDKADDKIDLTLSTGVFSAVVQ